MIFVDSNILIDVVARNGPSSEWSLEALSNGASRGRLVTNHGAVAEVVPSFLSLALELGFLRTLGIEIVAFSDEAAYLAGKVHAAYCAAGGTREAVLADFLIGGHAAALDARLLTRDRQRFAAYFPALGLITPDRTHG